MGIQTCTYLNCAHNKLWQYRCHQSHDSKPDHCTRKSQDGLILGDWIITIIFDLSIWLDHVLLLTNWCYASSSCLLLISNVQYTPLGAQKVGDGSSIGRKGRQHKLGAWQRCMLGIAPILHPKRPLHAPRSSQHTSASVAENGKAHRESEVLCSHLPASVT